MLLNFFWPYMPVYILLPSQLQMMIYADWYADWCWLIVVDADWCWLILIDPDWCWLALVDADICWLMLINADWCLFMLLDDAWSWLICWLIRFIWGFFCRRKPRKGMTHADNSAISFKTIWNRYNYKFVDPEKILQCTLHTWWWFYYGIPNNLNQISL